MPKTATKPEKPPAPSVSFAEVLALLWPYLKRNIAEQVKSLWFIIFYLIAFQILVLGLPIVYSAMIGVGLAIVVVGLMFFMEGLRLGLMPLGEAIGSVLPARSSLPWILLFAFLLGIGATFAEPAIAVLRAAGAGVSALQNPLLYSLLNDYPDQLVLCVGVGVGFAVLLGVLRFFYEWSLKLLIVPAVLLLSGLTLFCHQIDVLDGILGLAWDCGAVTTGPVTVPLVLALGIGVCRIVGQGGSANGGFGIVTLASLFPILAVLLLSLWHYSAQDYVGAQHYPFELPQQSSDNDGDEALTDLSTYTEEDLLSFRENGLPQGEYEVHYRGGELRIDDGRLVLAAPDVVFEKIPVRPSTLSVPGWDTGASLAQAMQGAVMDALRAILPLCIFLFVVLRFFLGEKLQHGDQVMIGVVFAFVGMSLFGLGIMIGLTPLGSQLGGNVPAAFASVTPWELNFREGPLYGDGHAGKLVAIAFAFFLGYGATLAEPALNALGNTVERITIGAFPKPLLMQSVAFGVGVGIAVGICKIAYGLPLVWLLLPPYLLLIVLTVISSEDFVNFGWDSAGVTTGPITVPLVLAIGLGVGANVPGSTDGFGVLALASVGPIITVLSVGLLVNRRETAA